MRKIVSVLISLSLLIAMAICSSVMVKAEGEENVALNKPVTSSGFFGDALPEGAEEGEEASTAYSEEAKMVNDGKLETKWCARQEDYEGEEDDFEEVGHWITIDLEKATTVSKYIIHQASEGERDLGKFEYNMVSFKIEVSVDGTKWYTLTNKEDLFEEAEEGEEYENFTVSFDPISIRYFRLSSVQPALGEKTIRLPEIEVYSAAAGATAVDIETAINKLNEAEAAKKTPEPVKTTAPAKTTSNNTTAPKATATATNGSSDGNNDGLSTEVLIAIIAGAVVVIGGGIGGFIVVKKKKSK